jgi:DNA polymerase-3 subunit epsilon
MSTLRGYSRRPRKPESVPISDRRTPTSNVKGTAVTTQPDFFSTPAVRETGVAEPRPSASNTALTAAMVAGNDEASHEMWARDLESTGRYRVLRKLQPKPLVPRKLAAEEKVAVVLDTETTGLDGAKDEIIELGMIAFTYREDGQVGDIVDIFGALHEPSIPITPTITKLTGITPEMVVGHVLDVDAGARFIERAAVVIAHNARFDRPFCERLAAGFDVKAWACSATEVDWSDLGFEGAKLGYLVGQLGWFYEKHRAVNDCHALLEVLGAPLANGRGTGLMHLISSARMPRYRIWATHRGDAIERAGIHAEQTKSEHRLRARAPSYLAHLDGPGNLVVVPSGLQEASMMRRR